MALSFTALTTLSTPPSKADPENFTSRADTFLGELPDFQTEMNTTITELNKITSGLDAASVIAAWAVGTTYDFPDLVAGSDGYTYRCIDTAVIGENPITDNGTHWIRVSEAPLGNPASNGMVLASTTAGVRSWQYAGIGVTPASVTLTGGISGLNISRTGANQITVSIGFALDSTGSLPLSLAAATAATIPSVGNTVYHIFVARLVSDSSITVKAYTTEAGVASDATVDRWRWVGFCRTNGSSVVAGFTMGGDFINFWIASENVLSANVTTTYAAVDHSSFIPESRIELIGYGARDATVSGTSANLYASDDGTNTSFYVGRPVGSISDTSSHIWGEGVESPMQPYLAAREFRSSSGTLDLLIRMVKLRR